MPFVSPKDKRQRSQDLVFQEKNMPDTPFGIAFSSAVGQVFDEGLSISGSLNRQGWTDRQRVARELIDSGEVDRDKYLVRHGRGYRFDYEALAQDDDRVMTNEQLEDERKELLRQRREMSEDELSRGSGLAQFTGSMTGYLLDPISVATMPIATAATAAKSLSTLGRIAIGARNAAALEMGVELAIQPLVFQHKMDIDSPYSAEEALQAIVTAGIGAGTIAGVTGGLAGYFKKIRSRAEELPDSKDKSAAMENLQRMEETLKDNPHRSEDMSHEQMVEADRVFLQELEEQRRVSGSPTRKPDDYIEPESVKRDPQPSVSRETSVVERMGIKEDYDLDIARFREKQGGQAQRVDQLDQDFGDIKVKESVRVRQTGKIKQVDVDANTLWRQTVKRRSVAERLEKCANA